MSRDFRIYKPNKNKDGAASKLELRQKTFKNENNGKEYSEWMLFWVAAKQTGEDANGNASFDWKNDKNPNSKQITIKLGDPDVGEILSVVDGRKLTTGKPGGRGLYHDKGNGENSAFQLTFLPAKDASQFDDQYSLRVSAKDAKGVVTEVKHMITLAEMQIIKQILIAYIMKQYT